MDKQEHYPCEHCGWLVTDDMPACPRCGREPSTRLRPNYFALGISVAVAIALALILFVV